MLRTAIHRKYMFEILTDIYKLDIAKKLAFKWWTLCYFLYNLDRFSTDLDFDILKDINEEELFDAIKKILIQKWKIKESYIKRNTIFFLFSYGETDMNIKIEISRRGRVNNTYEIKNFYGTPILTMWKTSIFSNKIVALTDRRKIANRDIYDTYFMLKNSFELNSNLIMERTWKTEIGYIMFLIDFLKKLWQNYNILDWLWEVLDEKQKAFVKTKLLPELIWLLEFKRDFAGR